MRRQEGPRQGQGGTMRVWGISEYSVQEEGALRHGWRGAHQSERTAQERMKAAGAGWTQGSRSDWKGKPIGGPRDQVKSVGFILGPGSRCRNPRVHLLVSEEGWGGEEGGSGEMQAEGPYGRGWGSDWVVCKGWGRVGGGQAYLGMES